MNRTLTDLAVILGTFAAVTALAAALGAATSAPRSPSASSPS